MGVLRSAIYRYLGLGLITVLLTISVGCGAASRAAITGFGPVEATGSTCAAGRDIGIAVSVDNPDNLSLEYHWTTSPLESQMSVSSPKAPAGIYKCPDTLEDQTITVQVLHRGRVLDQDTVIIRFGGLSATSNPARPTPTATPTPVPTRPPTSDPPQGPPPEPIVFADLDWPSARLQNAIAKFIIEHGYGYPVDGIPGSAEPLWHSLFNGNVQVFMEAWLPNHEEWFDEAMINGSGIPLGKSLDDNWQSAFVVPTYVIQGDPTRGIAPMAPDLVKVEDLRNYQDVFATPTSGGRAIIHTCLVEWACHNINKAQVRAHGLNEVLELNVHRSADSLIESLDAAYEQGEPWLGYVWAPTRSSAGLDLTLLEQPPYTVECWESDKRCAYPISQIRIVVHPSLITRAPDVVVFLIKWDLSTSAQISVENYINETGADSEAASLWFLRKQEAIWTQWVTPDIVQRVRTALREQGTPEMKIRELP